jgi:hypothetical protein
MLKNFHMSAPADDELHSSRRAMGKVTGIISIYSIVRWFLYSVNMNDTQKNLLLYITKCVAAVGLIYFLSYLFHYPDIG